MIVQFPIRTTNVFHNVHHYVDLYQEEGVLEASVFYSTLGLPEQLKVQFMNELQKEFNERGLDVTVQK